MEKIMHPRAVKFDHFGGVDVLDIVEVDRPSPGIGQVVVRVRAAGINIGESMIREGRLEDIYPTSFPSGEGSDLAGIVEEVGEGVGKIAVGDEVIGFTNNRDSHADYVLTDADQLTLRPAEVPWEQAGALFIVGSTAYAAVKAVSVKSGDTVVVSAAAGGVGSVAVQLAKNAGAKVIGLASEPNHKWLSDHGIIPVTYGEGVADRIRKASDGKI
ncbi:MAG TPA: NADP-dependent oxidoreductase, partial [Puia sp.]|nr:NADP-dependent oxidoreductase [Puia sp.]